MVRDILNARSWVRRWLACGLLVALGLVVPLAQAAETVTYYYMNQQGTPLATADASGSILTTSDYRPYGGQVLGSPATGPGYTGHVNDPDSGLVYMQARYYDPVVGRFMGADPAGPKDGDPSQFGRYAYASNDPVGNIDPDGRRATVVNGAIVIQPEDHNVPNVAIPNTVGATGVAPGLFFHEYLTGIATKLTLDQAGNGLKNNPTPGDDSPASPGGTLNNVGALPPLSENNFVRSFSVTSPDPSKFSNITVNYTEQGEHSLSEGFVMRYAEAQNDGSVVIQNYGEGNSIYQSAFTGQLPLMMEDAVWRENVKEIEDDNH